MIHTYSKPTKLYGWYSMNAYNNGEKEFIYNNLIGQTTYCTIISSEKVCPYPSNHYLYSDVVFMGELVKKELNIKL